MRLWVCRGFKLTIGLGAKVLSRDGPGSNCTCDTLWFSFAGITEIAASAFQGLPQTTIVSVNFHSMERLSAGAFAGLPNLKSLFLIHGDLSEISVGSFAGLEQLSSLSLQSNKLSAIAHGVFLGLHSLTSLDLAHNQLASLTPGVFAGLDRLEQLSLYGNPLSTLTSFGFSGLTAIKALHLSNLGVGSVFPDAFAGLGALEQLFLQGNAIAHLPTGAFRGLANVSELALTGNGLSSIAPGAWEGLDSLRALDLSDNSVTSVGPGGWRGLEGLQRLELGENGITDLAPLRLREVGGLVSLTVRGDARTWNMGSQHQGLRSVDAEALAGLEELEELELSWHHIESVAGAFVHLPALRRLDLRRNSIRYATVDAFSGVSPNITFLGLRANRFNTLGGSAFRRFARLETLDLADNWIQLKEGWTSLAAFEGLASLQELDLSGNEARFALAGLFAPLAGLRRLLLTRTNMLAVPDDLWQGLGRLEFLDISGNWQIGYRSDGGPSTLPAGRFKHLGGLQTLELGGTSWNVVEAGAFSELRSLRVLDLSGGHAKFKLRNVTAGAFAGMRSLQRLLLCCNELADLAPRLFEGLPSLLDVDVSDNLVATAGPDLFAGSITVQTLNLAHNRLRNVSAGMLRGLADLRTLDLSHNAIRNLSADALQDLVALQNLDVSANRLASLPPGLLASLRQLRQLSAQENLLAQLSDGVFGGLSLLEALSLRSNRLERLPDRLFEGLRQLRTVDLANNSIAALPDGILVGLAQLESLDLDHNDLRHLEPWALLQVPEATGIRLTNNPLQCVPVMLPSALSRTPALPYDEEVALEGLRREEAGGSYWCLPLGCGRDVKAALRSDEAVGLLGTMLAVRAAGRVMRVVRGDAVRALDASLLGEGLVVRRGRERCWCVAGGRECYEVEDDAKAGGGACRKGLRARGANGSACVDVDECAEGVHSCGEEAVCRNSEGSFWCECAAGWRSAEGGRACVDADECGRAEPTHNCDANAACSNTNGSFACSCLEGWSGDGVVGTCNMAPNITQVTVPEMVLSAAVSEPPSELVVRVEFEDAGDDGPHVLALDLGCDGSVDAEAAVPGGGTEGELSLLLAQELRGLHRLCVRVADSRGLEEEEEVEGMVVLYDPADGFVTGAGSFDSPAGAMAAASNPALPVAAGPASFAFYVRYHRGEPYPRGYLRLVVREPWRRGWKRSARVVMELEAERMDWLAVLSEEDAKFMGEATAWGVEVDEEGVVVGGDGWRRQGLKVMVTVRDRLRRWRRCRAGRECDGIRVKVWDGEGGHVVFDNVRGAEDAGMEGSDVEWGRVKVHRPRDKRNLALRPLEFYLDPAEGWRVAEGGGAGKSRWVVLAGVGLGVLMLGGLWLRRRRRKQEGVHEGGGVDLYGGGRENCVGDYAESPGGRVSATVVSPGHWEGGGGRDLGPGSGFKLAMELAAGPVFATASVRERCRGEPFRVAVAGAGTGAASGSESPLAHGGVQVVSAVLSRPRWAASASGSGRGGWVRGPLQEIEDSEEGEQEGQGESLAQDASGVWQGTGTEAEAAGPGRTCQ